MPIDIKQTLTDYVRCQSVSTDPAYAEGMTQSREFAEGILKQLGFTVETVKTPLHPIILAERDAPEGSPHVIVYGHYDVQPADPFNLWTTPAFEATVRGERLYGRGTADNKGPQVVQWAGLSRLLERRPDLPLKITYLIEGEEEMGSPSFPGFIQQYGNKLREADLIILSDTGIPNTEQMVLTTGLRGLTGLEVTVTGPSSDLHSGVHGGAIRNPISALAELITSLHTPEGKVAVPGFYDAVIDPADWEREELAKLPLDEAGYKKFLGVSDFRPEPGYSPFEAIRFRPTIEFNGIGGGYQGEGSKTVIPSKAFAKITCRLVPNQEPMQIRDQVAEYLRKQAPVGVTVDVLVREAGVAYGVIPPDRPNTPAEQPEALARTFRSAHRAIEDIFGKPPLYLREGGSVPIIGELKEHTGLDSVMLGLFTPECRLHAPDESFHLGLAERASQVYERIFEDLADRR